MLRRSNLESNIGEGGEASVVEHVWGKDCTTLIRTTGRPTLLVACDVMYIDEAQPVDDLVQASSGVVPGTRKSPSSVCCVGALDRSKHFIQRGSRPAVLVSQQHHASVQTLVEIPDWSTEGAQAIVAHGRNARGEVLFLASCKRAGLLVQDVPMSELHPLFIADDVTVLRITRSRKRQ